MTSRSLYDEQLVSLDYSEDFFFKSLQRWAPILSRRPWLRRAARMLTYAVDVRRLWAEFKRDRPDIVHVQWTLVPLIDRRLLKHIVVHAPIVLTIHDTVPRQAALSRIADMRPLYRLATRLIVHAEENKRVVLERSPIDPQTVHVVPHGPTFERLPERSGAEARAALGIGRDAQVILFFGLIKPYKGLLDLIEAARTLVAEFPHMHLLIAGKPEGPVDGYSAALAKHGLDKLTTFHPVFIPTERVPDYFAASDIVCLPYREASQSGVLLAAYRFGKPVVVTAVGALPESVDEGNNGYIVPPANPAALAEALGRLLADVALRERFGQRSRELVRECLSWERAAELTEKIYRQALADHRGS